MTVSSATFGAGSPTKAAALLQLARKRQSSHLDDYACIGDFHDGIYECDHVSPWTKSGCNLDAEVMVVGQDWSSADVLEGNGRPDPVRARLGYDPRVPHEQEPRPTATSPLRPGTGRLLSHQHLPIREAR